MEKNEKEQIESYVSALHFLTWQDTLDRLDTLILEARHIQQNIIYTLRLPIFYRLLRWEEKFLYEEKTDFWKKLKNKRWDIDPDIMARKCIRLVLREKREEIDSSKEQSIIGDEEDIVNDILKEIKKETLGHIKTSKWNMDQRKNFHSLRIIQTIKRNIFRDKLFFCKKGLKAFGLIGGTPNMPEQVRLNRFQLVRTAINAKIRNYVARVGDHQAGFSTTQDAGLLDHPRPTLGRRREQCNYNNFLSYYCRNMLRTMHIFMDKLKIGIPKDKPRFLFQHRWQHHFTSRSLSFEDELASSDEIPRIHYFNTSYFMPERADLQSVISHEVAHGIIKDYLNDLTEQSITLSDSSFCDLIRRLHRGVDIYQVDKITSPNLSLIHEITVDLIATAIVGPAYLFALFLDTLGVGLEDLFFVPPDRIDLKMVEYLDGTAGRHDQTREWYIRLHIVCTWLQYILVKRDEDFKLTSLFIGAVRRFLENLLDYLDSIARPDQRYKRYWRTLKNRLCNMVEKSQACKDVKKWREEFDNDAYKWKKWRRGGKYINGPQKLPRYTRPLNFNIRKFLVWELMDRKRIEIDNIEKDHDKSESDDPQMVYKGLKQHSEQVYQLKPLKEILKDLTAPKKGRDERYQDIKRPRLFKYLHDIPWQCSMLRALDFVHPKSIMRLEKADDPINMMHNQSPLGEDIYLVALEFYSREVESAEQRMDEVFRLLEDIKHNKKEYEFLEDHKEIMEVIENWMGKEGSKETGKFLKEIKRVYNKHKDKENYPKSVTGVCKGLAKKYPAEVLISASLEEKELEPYTYRLLNRIIGFSLKNLCKELQKIKEPSKPKFNPLISYLSIRGGNKEERFRPYKKIINAIMPENIGHTPGGSTKTHGRMVKLLGRMSTGSPKLGPSLKSLHKDTIGEKGCLLLGRYDKIIIYPYADQIARHCMPRFPEKSNENGEKEEKFLPFFVRWELAMEVGLGNNSNLKDECSNLLGLVSVSLNRNATRLDFLYRLLGIIEDGQGKKSETEKLLKDRREEFKKKMKDRITERLESYPPEEIIQEELKDELERYGKEGLLENLHEVGCYFDSEKDRIFLSDGWGDLLIMFYGKPEERLEEIFVIQHHLYEDFQVDRTELYLTPQCVGTAVKEGNKYRVSVHFRLEEDRLLSRSNVAFTEKLKEREFEKYMEERDLRYIVTRTPGLMDYILRLYPNEAGEGKPESNWSKPEAGGAEPDLYKFILEELKDQKIDRIVTNIQRVKIGKEI